MDSLEKLGSLIGSLVVVGMFLLFVLIAMNIPKVFKKKFEQLDQQCTTGGKHSVMKNILFVLLYNLVFAVPLAFFFESQEVMSGGFWNAATFLSILYGISRFGASIQSVTSPKGPFKDVETEKTRLISEDRLIVLVASFLSLPVIIAGNMATGYLVIRFDSFLLGFVVAQGVEMGFSVSFFIVAIILSAIRIITSKSYRQKKEEAHKRWFIAKTAGEISSAALGGYYLVRPGYVHPSDDNPKDSPTDAPIID